jgi:Uri superfamily endonuclease
VKGSYILILQLDHPLGGLQVGRLGRFDFAPGYYLYVGSAYGPGGLEARLAYHLRREKSRPHWHIDYLRTEARLREAWSVSGSARLECTWCETMAAHPALSAPVPGFGSRDTGCHTHLFYLPRAPHPSLLSGIILATIAADHSTELQIEIHSFDDG